MAPQYIPNFPPPPRDGHPVGFAARTRTQTKAMEEKGSDPLVDPFKAYLPVVNQRAFLLALESVVGSVSVSVSAGQARGGQPNSISIDFGRLSTRVCRTRKELTQSSSGDLVWKLLLSL